MKPWHVFVALAITLASHSTSGAAASAAALRESDIVFEGHVTRTSGITVPGVAADERLVAVEVERVIVKPQAALLKQGDTVIVSVSDSVPEVGLRARFYAAAWIYGHFITVHEKAREAVPKFAAVESAAIQAQLREAKLDPVVDSADAAIVGQVMSVSTPSARPELVTEHDPQWQEAVVSVQSWIKGGTVPSVKVRFPASIDVAWYRVPKLKPGMTQTFLLHAEPLTLNAQPGTVATYRIESPLDVLPADDEPLVRKLTQQ